MPECLTIALMFICNGIGIFAAYKLFNWFEGQPATYDIKKNYLRNVRKEKWQPTAHESQSHLTFDSINLCTGWHARFVKTGLAPIHALMLGWRHGATLSKLQQRNQKNAQNSVLTPISHLSRSKSPYWIEKRRNDETIMANEYEFLENGKRA